MNWVSSKNVDQNNNIVLYHQTQKFLFIRCNCDTTLHKFPTLCKISSENTKQTDSNYKYNTNPLQKQTIPLYQNPTKTCNLFTEIMKTHYKKSRIHTKKIKKKRKKRKKQS